MIENEEGSIMVEAAIIFPIVIVVVFVLITMTLIVHDLYVSRLMLEVIDEQCYDVNIENEIEERMLTTSFNSDQVYTEESVKDNQQDKAINYSISYRIPFIGNKDYDYISQSYTTDGLKKIMLVELTGDIFDDLTISKAVKDKYELLLKSVMSELEND